MLTAVIILSVGFAAAVLYIIALRRQIKSVNRQLETRRKEQSSQALHIDLIDSKLNRLASNINDALEAEKRLRIRVQEDERHFRELIANVSHDMRTPLTAVKGYLQMLDHVPYNADDRESYNMAVKHVNVMQQRVEQFFEYSYYISRDDVPKLSPVNLTNEIVESILEFFPLYEERGRKIIFERERPAIIAAERSMLRRILQNLLNNSLRHSVGDTFVSIRNENTLVISNKVLNPAEIDVTKLFDRFYTADKARTTSTGLGLSIVKLLADKMNAAVSADIKGNSLEIFIKFTKQNQIKSYPQSSAVSNKSVEDY